MNFVSFTLIKYIFFFAGNGKISSPMNFPDTGMGGNKESLEPIKGNEIQYLFTKMMWPKTESIKCVTLLRHIKMSEMF